MVLIILVVFLHVAMSKTYVYVQTSKGNGSFTADLRGVLLALSLNSRYVHVGLLVDGTTIELQSDNTIKTTDKLPNNAVKIEVGADFSKEEIMNRAERLVETGYVDLKNQLKTWLNWVFGLDLEVEGYNCSTFVAALLGFENPTEWSPSDFITKIGE